MMVASRRFSGEAPRLEDNLSGYGDAPEGNTARRTSVVTRVRGHIESIDPRSPLTAVPYTVLKDLGYIPRSHENMAITVSSLPVETKLIFFSHRWLRPWRSQDECEANGQTWAGAAHPDDSKGSKAANLLKGAEVIAQDKGWPLEHLAIWIGAPRPRACAPLTPRERA